MRKSQRARLSALLAKGNALNATESAEIAWLNALAAAHTDPSKDEDDAPTGFRAALLEAVGGRKTLAAELVTARTRIAELEAAQATASNTLLIAVLDGLGLKGAELAAKSTDEIVAAVKAPLVAAEAKSTAAAGTISLFVAALGMKASEVVDEKSARAAVEARLGALAGEKLAELGFPESKIPAAGGQSAEADTLEEIQAQMKETADPVALGKLAAKANALRDQAPGKP